ncbi:MAG TPA: ribonuclease HII [Ignavibacteriales bacterium]|nr:ribonuclease HII [Ignavibacteriales bacterium]
MKNFDNAFLSESVRLIAGIDEAGRGPLAGPVAAASVIFDPGVTIGKVNDSKKLCESLREELYLEITEKALAWGVSIVSHEEIDRINILQASLLAMKNSLEGLSIVPDLAIIDGNKVFPSKIPTKAIVKGDGKSFCIAAASIIAKVTRDRLMRELSESHPEYMWHKNKGYGTREHIKALVEFGPSPYHRKTFLKHFIMEENEPGIE